MLSGILLVLYCTGIYHVSHSPVYSSERKGFILNLNPPSSSRIIAQQNLSFNCMTWLQIKKKNHCQGKDTCCIIIAFLNNRLIQYLWMYPLWKKKKILLGPVRMWQRHIFLNLCLWQQHWWSPFLAVCDCWCLSHRQFVQKQVDYH